MDVSASANETTRTADAVRQRPMLDGSSSFDSFYRLRRDEIGRALALTVGDRSLGFEAADEAMARAYERWDSIVDGPNPSGWVYRTGLNWARSWLRRGRRLRSGEKVESAAPSQAVVDYDLARAIETLTDDHRSVIVLRYHLDWTVDQIADALQVRPGTVKSRLSRAIDQLNTTLDTGPDERRGL